MGVAPVVRGDERLKRRLAALALAAAACAPPLQQDPEAAFYLAFEGPPPRPLDFRGGALSGRGQDVWMCFGSNTELKLRDADRFHSADPREHVQAFSAVCPQPVLDDPGALRGLQTGDPDVESSGRLVLYDAAGGRYFIRAWRH